MIVLSTAYKQALIGIELDGKQTFKCLDANCKHSENLLPALDELLQEVGKCLADNDKYAVVIGPGSFTGLRISTSLIKGLLAGENTKNVLALTTFDLMAYSYIKNFAPKENFVCVINALSGKYFVCEYSCTGDKIGAEMMIDKEAFSKLDKTTVSLEEEGVGQQLISPSAQELLALAKQKYDKSNLISAAQLVPLYIRKSQAEDALAEKEKK
ncbi:MAG: tRNA (adenosine(37)-N6)-threonylcarbamoyltransferase complex dimerization subunit type 1 TsaB [Clostridia bacterium]|nr:tRNA (adenosine(37)-N6)-threonylcarbamoyltransferase complex dimerization subunit type 1 TsaB [Clostridia bacterium]